MIYVKVMTKGFERPNAISFLYPLIVFNKQLRNCGIKLKIISENDNPECDLLIIESSIYRHCWHNREQVINTLQSFKQHANKLYYFDLADSSCMPHAHALNHIDGYFKSYLLKDRQQYLKPLYGFRTFTDYYHNTYDIKDDDNAYSVPIENSELLKKLGVSWASCYTNYNYLGLYLNELYRRFPLKLFLKFPRKYTSPSINRPNPLACRIGTNYSRNSVAFQRQLIKQKIADRLPISRVSRKLYFKEMQQSKLVLSPFGFGEVCYRDYETWLSGSLLIKPDMSHMETWPNLYKANKTVLFHSWNLDDLEEKIDRTIENYAEYIDVAKQGQANYKKFVDSKESAELFCQHFINIVNKL